jgi:hypothetical protein
MMGTVTGMSAARINEITNALVASGDIDVSGNLILTTRDSTAINVGSIPVIDTTATDIKPAGIQASGATGKAADAGHIHPYPAATAPIVLLGGGASQSGKYQIVQTVNIGAQFEDYHGTLLMLGSGGGATPGSMSLINFRVKQQNAMASAPYIELYSNTYSSGIVPAAFTAVTTTNTSGATVVQLWFQAQQDFETYQFFLVGQSISGASVTFGGGSGWVVSGPAGPEQLGVFSGSPVNITAADILALGTQAAGTSGKLADARHVHPNSIDGWQPITLPGGSTWAGTFRVKKLIEKNTALMDISATFTTTTAAGTYAGGSMPSASYYPTVIAAGSRQYDLCVNQPYTAISNASPRISFGTSGAVSLLMPAFATAGNTVMVTGTAEYPLD